VAWKAEQSGWALAILAAAGIATEPLRHSLAPPEEHSEIGFPTGTADEMGPALGMGLLGGARALLADMLWLRAYTAWAAHDAERTSVLIRAVTAVDGRPLHFWLNGARIIAYDLTSWRLTETRGDVPLEVRRRVAAGQAAAAIDYLQECRRRHPGSAAVCVEIGNIELYGRGDLEAAAAWYRRAAETPGAPACAARIHAELLRRLGRNREALLWLRKVHASLPAGDPQEPLLQARIRELERGRASRRRVRVRRERCACATRRGPQTSRVPQEDARWRIWIAAARPRTLPAAVAPVIVGSALAWSRGALRPVFALVCLVFALLMQIAANFANDYFDFVKGADTGERVGPKRAVAAGLVAPRTMLRATVGTLLLALACGLTLVAAGGWWLLAVGAACIVSCLAYTGGPYPLGYHGLGDLFVFIFFGLVAVGATFYVQAGMVSAEAWLGGAAMGALIVNILVVNNYRDAETDAKAGKRTLVVRFGKRFSRAQFAAAHAVALGILAVFCARRLYPAAFAVPAGLLLGVVALVQCRRLGRATRPEELIALLGACGRYVLLYAGALAALLAAGA